MTFIQYHYHHHKHH